MKTLVVRFATPEITAKVAPPATFRSRKAYKQAVNAAKQAFHSDYVKTVSPTLAKLGVKITNDKLPNAIAVSVDDKKSEAFYEWCTTNSHTVVDSSELAFNISDED